MEIHWADFINDVVNKLLQYRTFSIVVSTTLNIYRKHWSVNRLKMGHHQEINTKDAGMKERCKGCKEPRVPIHIHNPALMQGEPGLHGENSISRSKKHRKQVKDTWGLVVCPQSQVLQRLRSDLKSYTLSSKAGASLGYLTRPFLKIKIKKSASDTVQEQNT